VVTFSLRSNLILNTYCPYEKTRGLSMIKPHIYNLAPYYLVIGIAILEGGIEKDEEGGREKTNMIINNLTTFNLPKYYKKAYTSNLITILSRTTSSLKRFQLVTPFLTKTEK